MRIGTRAGGHAQTGPPVAVSAAVSAMLVLTACTGAADDQSASPDATAPTTATPDPTPTTPPTSPSPTDGSSSPSPSPGPSTPDASGSEGPTSSPSPSPSPDPSPQLQTAPAEIPIVEPAGPGLAERCTQPAPDAPTIGGALLAHPEGWNVADSCRYFSPDLEELPRGSSAIGVEVLWRIDADSSFSDAAGPDPSLDESLRLVGVVGGLPAVRVAGTTTGEGLAAPGFEQTSWLVDLDPGTDEQGGLLLGFVRNREDVEYEQAVPVLDAMAGSARVEDPTFELPGVPTLRWEQGGGIPNAVTYVEGCLQLRAATPTGDVIDEACVQPTLDDAALGVTLLGEGDTSHAVGFARFDVDAVLVGDATTGAAPVTLEGGVGGFAVPAAPGERLTAFAHGQEVATLTLE